MEYCLQLRESQLLEPTEMTSNSHYFQDFDDNYLESCNNQINKINYNILIDKQQRIQNYENQISTSQYIYEEQNYRFQNQDDLIKKNDQNQKNVDEEKCINKNYLNMKELDQKNIEAYNQNINQEEMNQDTFQQSKQQMIQLQCINGNQQMQQKQDLQNQIQNNQYCMQQQYTSRKEVQQGNKNEQCKMDEQIHEELRIQQNNKEKEDQQNRDDIFGELEFEEFAYSENSILEEPEQRILMKYILHKTLKPVEAFLLNGEIIVSFDLFKQKKNQEHDKVSIWNMFRPINKIKIFKSLVEVNMHESQSTISDFQPIIQSLIDMPDQNAQASAQLLIKHYNSVQKEKFIKQQISEFYGSHIKQLQWQLEENFFKSQQMAYQMMEQLPEDAIFLYSIRRTDPISFDSIFCALGYSKSLIRLVAGNEVNYQQFCLRQGLAEIFNSESRLQILLMNLLYSNKLEISITTLDDMIIPIEMRVHYQKLIQTEILPGVFKEDYMKIYEIIIDQKYIDQINKHRESQIKQNNIVNNSLNIIQPDQDYFKQSNKFIEKYYSDILNQKQNGAFKKSQDKKHCIQTEFQRIFGKQNEGNNYLDNVFNTTIIPQQEIMQNN